MNHENKRYSMLFLSSVIQGGFFAVAVLILFLGIWIWQAYARKELTEESLRKLKAESRVVSLRLEEKQALALELVRHVAQYKSVYAGSAEAQSVLLKTDLLQTINEKNDVYDSPGCLFVCRRDGFFVSADTQKLGKNQFQIRTMVEAFFRDKDLSDLKGKWFIRNADNTAFLLYCFYFEKADMLTGITVPCSYISELIDRSLSDMDGIVLIDADGRQSDELKKAGRYETAVSEHLESEGIEIRGIVRLDIMSYLRRGTWMLLMIVVLLGMLLIGIFNLIYRKFLLDPVHHLSDEVREISSEGADVEKLHISQHGKIEEIVTLETALNHLLGEVIKGRMELYIKETEDNKQKLRQLRSQLRSHFYLNAIMTVNAMLYQNRNDDIRSYLSLLSDHMRYMMRLDQEMVRLQEELQHIENYLNMQKLKQKDSIVYYMECPSECGDIEIPHLILYTIVENAMKHAANLIDTLDLYIVAEIQEADDFRGLSISIEDNGPGFSVEAMEKYMGNHQPESSDENHIGLNNIRQSLNIRYGRDDLLRIENVLPHGAKVEIRIPYQEE